ncbi:hypothetical protein FRC03_010465 [Tulasnella sp. 419]|nr:hypothetical protein FRC03_010465 [Tulasnella sp. 419]
MFSLPQTEQSEVDGTSESRPIHFIDKPKRFASLLWALYALPAELRSISESPENVSKLIDIAKAAQRYAFKSTEAWALNCLVDIVKSGFRISKRGINPWHIFALASLCNCDELRKAMITKIKDSAAAGKVAYPWVVLIADALGIQELQGEAYYKLVIRGHEGWTELEESVVRRLYIGFCKLVTFKDQLFADPMPIILHECTGPGPCRARWAVQWKESQAPDPTQPAIPSVDIVGQLKACAANLRRNRVYPGPCHDAWLATIEAKAKELEDGIRLYQFFIS